MAQLIGENNNFQAVELLAPCNLVVAKQMSVY